MAEQFINYKVELVIHDSSKIRGYVKEINDKTLVISDAEFVGKNKTLKSYKISGNLINDLFVIEIPKEALVRKKKDNTETVKNNNNNINENLQKKLKTPSKAFVDDAIIFQNQSLKSVNRNSPKPQQPLLDDAIIFAKPSKSNGSEGSKTTSVANSPKPPKRKISKSKKNNSNYYEDNSDSKYSNSRRQEETWSDDIAEIKESQDFDFATNLALFDKASVFKDLKSKDKISFANRLAGHNKADTPAKKINYEHTEMVLNDKEDIWDTISAVGESGESALLTNHVTKNNELPENTKAKKLIFEEMSSGLKKPKSIEMPVESKKAANNRPAVFSPIEVSSVDVKFSLPNSKGVLSLSSPLQLLEIERLSIENYGFSRQLFAENGSIGLSRLIIRLLGGANRLANNYNKPPLVLLLVGNNRAGARALATGRQLANRGVRVIAFVLNNDIGDFLHELDSNTKSDTSGKSSSANSKQSNSGRSRTTSTQHNVEEKEIFYDAEEEFNTDVKDQLKLFVSYGGKVFNKFSSLEKSLSALDSPLELVIDALQGYDTTLSDLWGDELELCLDVIYWVNNLSSKVKVVSLDISSGLDGGSGQFSLTVSDVHQTRKAKKTAPIGVDDLRVNSDIIVSLGLPVIGLHHAYYLGHTEIGDWTHYLIDLGVPRKVYSSKGSLRKFDKDYFADEWHTELLVGSNSQ